MTHLVSVDADARERLGRIFSGRCHRVVGSPFHPLGARRSHSNNRPPQYCVRMKLALVIL